MKPAAPAAAGPAGVPPLSRGEKGLLAGAVVFGGGVGAIGLAASFDTVAKAGERWGFGMPELLPVGIDIAIPVFTVANLLLIRMGMPLAWVRFVPWALTAVTCWLNVATGNSLSAKVAHGTMPLLWVVLSEIAAHVYAVRIGKATGARMERIRRSRWLLAPLSTFALWRRMVLWETTSYRDALAREKERQLARADLRQQYGRLWRRRTPRRERVLLKLGDLAPDNAVPQAQSEERGPAPERSAAPRPELPEVVPAGVELLPLVARPKAPKPPAARAEAKPRPKRQSSKRKAAAPRRSREELLTQARAISAEWPSEALKAEPLRRALGCGQEQARHMRDTLRAERQEGSAQQSGDRPRLAAVSGAGEG
ncbi:DUF2637 domain-containing protein [Streptomyces sp. JJ36]|nr:DUF2637 domain-containing protein [Streptomyces sp. JJ36]